MIFNMEKKLLLKMERSLVFSVNLEVIGIIYYLLIEYVGKADRKTARFDNSIYKITYNPNLSQMGIYFDEDFIWQSLVEFLSNKRSEKEISPEVSNENKILSKGFDLKTSFRPNMKKKHKGDI